MRVALLVPAAFLLGALACRAALLHAPADVHADLTQPLPVVTYWQQFGALMWVLLFAAVAIASAGYIGAMRAVSTMRSDKRALLAIVAVGATACAGALAFPVVFSSDVYAYAAYGDLARHGIDPYAHAPVAVHDAVLNAALWQWGNPLPACVYGPVFVWFASALVSAFAPLGPGAPLWGFRVTSCAALLACAPLIYAGFKPLARDRRLIAAAGITLNPVAIWSCAEGHNDVLAVAIVLAGCSLIAARKRLTGSILAAIGGAVKLPAFAAAAALGLLTLRKSSFRSVIAGTAIGIAGALLLDSPLLAARAHPFAPARYFPQFSLQYALSVFAPSSIAVGVTALLCLTTIAFALHALVRGDLRGTALGAAACWIAVPNPYPWYALWLLPAALVTDRPIQRWALIGVTLLAVFRYYGDATTDLQPPLAIAIALVQILPLLAFIGVRMRFLRRGHPENRTAAPDLAPIHTP